MTEALEPALRHGLVGLCGLQLAVMVWLLRVVLVMARDLARMVEANTAAVRALDRQSTEWAARLSELRDLLLARAKEPACSTGR